MYQVRRWDSGTVGEVERTNQGYLRAPATITRTGVFDYRQPGGTVRRELRLPDEVFNPKTLASFGLAPLTNGHPPVMLNARNTARYQVGSVVEPKQDGDHVAAYVQVTDADAIEAAEAGRRQLSCGYTCALEAKPGVTQGIPGIPDGLHFDAIQRNIRGNHVALVDKARAGATVQLRLDGADAFQVEPEQSRLDADPTTVQTLIFDKGKYTSAKAVAWAKEHGFSAPKGADETEESLRVRERDPGQFQPDSFRTIELAPGVKAVIGRPKKTDSIDTTWAEARPAGAKNMEAKVHIDGVDYETTPQIEQAVSKLMARVDALSAELAETKKSLSEQQARADTAEENLAAEKKAHADATDPAKLQAAVSARLALERAAGPILGSEVKVDEMADADIKRAVVLAVAKDAETVKARLDGCDDVYLQARYDAAVESWEQSQEPNAGLAATRKAANQATRTDSISDARARMIAHNQEIGRKPLN